MNPQRRKFFSFLGALPFAGLLVPLARASKPMGSESRTVVAENCYRVTPKELAELEQHTGLRMPSATTRGLTFAHLCGHIDRVGAKTWMAYQFHNDYDKNGEGVGILCVHEEPHRVYEESVDLNHPTWKKYPWQTVVTVAYLPKKLLPAGWLEGRIREESHCYGAPHPENQ